MTDFGISYIFLEKRVKTLTSHDNIIGIQSHKDEHVKHLFLQGH